MNLTQAQKNTLKAHVLANTNTVARPADGVVVAINTIANADHGDNYQRIADWYNLAVTGAESQPFTTPNELWVPDVGIGLLNSAIDWTTLIPHGLGGSPTVDQQYLARVYKLLAWQSMTWNSRLDFTDAQQRGGIIGIFGASTATTTALAAVGVGRKTATRIERLFAGNAVGQAGIGGAIGRVAGTDAGGNRMYGQQLAGGDIGDAILNGV